MDSSSRLSHKKGGPFGILLLYLLVCLVIGFICGEIMGAILVRQSNRMLLAEQEWLEKMGYVAVPGTGLSLEIKSLKTYLAGGLFFGLSIGLCYAFVLGVLIWGLHPWPGIRAVTIFALLCGVFFLYLYQPGWTRLWVFGFFLFCIPFLLFPLCVLFKGYENKKTGLIKTLPFIAGLLGSILVVYILIAPSLTGSDFVRIRDGLFGRIAWGARVSDFYYHYTLYPARVIKAFNQRLQGVIRIEPEGFTEGGFRSLKRALAWRDIFIGKDAPSCALIKKASDSNKVSFSCKSPRFRLEAELQEWINDPDPMLEKYTLKTDSAVFLREGVRLSLFIIWPLMGIFFIYCLFLLLCNLIFRNPSLTKGAFWAFLMVFMLIMGLRTLLRPKKQSLGTNDLLAQIAAKGSFGKIQAILALWDRIEEERIQPEHFSGDFMKMLDDPDPIVRKWGIDFLTKTGEKGAIKPLIRLLRDPDPGVAYHAARGLGKLRAREARDPLLQIITSDNEWYLKTTAYIALRQIGWSQ